MKNLIKNIGCLLFLIIGLNTQAQTTTTESSTKNHSFMLSARAGYDFPWYYNNTPYIKYKGNVMAGISADYYWKYIGAGLDIDYLRNKPKNTYPTSNLQDFVGAPITSFANTSKAVNRLFFGIGPDFRYYTKNKKFVAEVNTRVGIGMILGGRTELRETTSANYLLNFHAGYDEKLALTAKAQLRLSYFFHKNFGVHVGTYYMRHFNVNEKVDVASGLVAKYQPFTTTAGTSTYTGPSSVRTTSCNCDIASVGVFAGLTYNLDFGKSKEKSSSNTLVVTAKDKYTHEVLPNTIVYLKDDANNVIQTATTDNNGVVKFEKVKPNNYRIEGTLNSIALDNNSVTKSELSSKKIVNKEIIYSDRNFIIKGKVFICNTTTPISGITVVLENNDVAFKKTTQTNANGEYLLQLPSTGEYNLYGKKENYFSQIERINTANYSRDKNLFVKLEMCSELIDCDKAIKLNNILFDVDKFDIKDAAKPELNKLVQFMKDNPTVKVEVSSHTDSRASAEYNQTLSQKRADASVDYIVSQGISRDRITGKGYGETKLLNGCADGVSCTEAQHAINRRTEMKVLCK